jgi:hypothetical protein
MKSQTERIRSRPGRLRQIGDRLTGGGLRALGANLLQRARQTGNRMTGGGLRNLSRRLSTKALRSAMDRPAIRTFARRLLQPFPQLSARLYRLASASEAVTGPTLPGQPLHQDPSLLANSLYRAAFGRTGDCSILANFSHQLEQGVPLERLAEQLTISAEFLTRYGRDQGVNTKYLCALYRDGLGRSPKVEDLAIWRDNASKSIGRLSELR